MKWSDTIRFDQPLSDVCLLMGTPTQDWQQFLTEREAAAYERGRREGETSLNEQLLNQRNATIELQRGILHSLQRTLPQVAHEAETSLLLLAVVPQIVRRLIRRNRSPEGFPDASRV